MSLSGKPEPLVYQIPQDFFNALLHRLSLSSKKRRLPNSTSMKTGYIKTLLSKASLFSDKQTLFFYSVSAFVKNDELHPGAVSKYTWHITNAMHVKRIFDTPEVNIVLCIYSCKYCITFFCFLIVTLPFHSCL